MSKRPRRKPRSFRPANGFLELRIVLSGFMRTSVADVTQAITPGNH